MKNKKQKYLSIILKLHSLGRKGIISYCFLMFFIFSSNLTAQTSNFSLICDTLYIPCNGNVEIGEEGIFIKEFHLAPNAIIDNTTIPLQLPVSINLPIDAQILNIRSKIAIDHSWVGDLELGLKSAMGSEISLMEEPGNPFLGTLGCPGDNILIELDDQATLNYTDLEQTCHNLPAINNSYQPLEAFSTLFMEAPNGNWEFIVNDVFPDLDDGLVKNLMLQFTYASDFTLPIPQGDFTLPLTYDHEDIITIIENATLEAIIERHWTVTDANGQVATLVQYIYRLSEGCESVLFQGNIKTEQAINIKNVNIELQDFMGTIEETASDLNGNYQFEVNEGDEIYSIRPTWDEHIFEGLTSYDLYLLYQHVLGIASLNSPYKMIAADANASGQIDQIDFDLIRDVILHRSDYFPNNNAWKFVDKNFIFPNPQMPLSSTFPEQIFINNFSPNLNQINFTAIKIGDLNNSAFPPAFPDIEGFHPNEAINLIVDNKMTSLERINWLEINLDEKEQLAALQFTLQYDPSLISILPHLVDKELMKNIGLKYMGEGKISFTCLPNSLKNKNLLILKLPFQAKKQLPYKDVFRLSSDLISAKAYSDQGKAYNLQVRFKNTLRSNTFSEPIITYPNPFYKDLSIKLYANKNDFLILNLIDISGQIIYENKYPIIKGWNEININDYITLKEGAYLLKFTLSQKNYIKKVVKMSALNMINE